MLRRRAERLGRDESFQELFRSSLSSKAFVHNGCLRVGCYVDGCLKRTWRVCCMAAQVGASSPSIVASRLAWLHRPATLGPHYGQSCRRAVATILTENGCYCHLGSSAARRCPRCHCNDCLVRACTAGSDCCMADVMCSIDRERLATRWPMLAA